MGTINSNLEYYRKSIGITRKELCEGICDTSTLYRIEKEDQLPRIDLLKKFCEKMEVPIEYLVSGIDKGNLQNIQRYKKIFREHIYHMNYPALALMLNEFEAMIKKYKYESEYSSLSRLADWLNCVLMHKLYNQPEKACKMLQKIFTKKLRTSLDINICNSLGLVILDLKGHEKAYHYFQKAYNALTENHKHFDQTLFPRISYNLAYCEFYLGNYQKALTIAYQILEYLEVNYLFYMYGKVKHMIGSIYEKTGDYNQAYKLIKHALYIFTIEEKGKYIDICESDLLRIKEKRTVKMQKSD